MVTDARMAAVPRRLGVVFVDIVSYSRRSTRRQIGVIARFQQDIVDCLNAIYNERLPYFLVSKIRLLDDAVKIPTGDGVALTLEQAGVSDLFLDFALRLLRSNQEAAAADPCPLFERHLWCDCHDHYWVRVGIASGDGFIYRDLNGNRNVAGRVINNASRIMGLGSARQLLLSGDIFDSIVDLSDDAGIRTAFRDLGTREVKHGELLRVVQYVGRDGEDFVDGGATC